MRLRRPGYQAQRHLGSPQRASRYDAAEHHQAWVEDKLAHGWRFGSDKDPERKTHPCLVSFDQLPRYQQDKNRLFIAIVRALWGAELPEVGE